jgi:amino acid transporter
MSLAPVTQFRKLVCRLISATLGPGIFGNQQMSNGHFIRVIRRREVLALAFGAMIGWSWVALTGDWIDMAGSLGAMLAFVIGGVVVIFVGLTYAELASAMPQAGGEHVYSHRALGATASFICTWAILLGYVSVVAFEAVALPTVVDYLVPGFSRGYLWTVAGWDVQITWVLVGVVAAVVMTGINILGIKTAAKLQFLVTTLVLAVGFMLISGAGIAGSADNMQPLFENGSKGLLSVLVMVPFMFVGFDVIPQSAEEVDIPFSEIGRMLMFSIFLAVFWYVLIIGWAAKLLVLAGMGGILTTWNAFLIGGSRAIYALARAGQLPRSLGKLHPRYNTPHNAVLLIGALSVISPLFGRPALVWLADAGGIAYAFVAASFLVLRKREPKMPRPYVVRNGRFIGVTALVLSLCVAVLYLPGSPAALVWPYEWVIVIAWVVLGAVMLRIAR